MNTRNGGEGFIGRWSRLKRGRTPEKAPEAPDPAAGKAAPGAGEAGGIAAVRRPPTPARPAAQSRSDAEILAELGLPDPDSLGPGADFSAYLRAELPQRLRNRVLRRLWLSSPVFANVDGLVDYGEDFTDRTILARAVETIYEVGRGFADRLDEAEERAATGGQTEGGQTGGGQTEGGRTEGGRAEPERGGDRDGDPSPPAPGATRAAAGEEAGAEPAGEGRSRVPPAAEPDAAPEAEAAPGSAGSDREAKGSWEAAASPPSARTSRTAGGTVRPPRRARIRFHFPEK